MNQYHIRKTTPGAAVIVLRVLQISSVFLGVFNFAFFAIAMGGHASIPEMFVDYDDAVNSAHNDYGKVYGASERLAFSGTALVFAMFPMFFFLLGSFLRLPFALDLGILLNVITLIMLCEGGIQVQETTYNCRIEDGPSTSDTRQKCRASYHAFMAGLVLMLLTNFAILVLSVIVKHVILRFYPNKSDSSIVQALR